MEQVTIKQETNTLKKLWTEMDINKNKMIPRECILEGYKKLYQSDEKANMEFKFIIANSDDGNNNMIDYSKLLAIIPDAKKTNSKAKIKEMFAEFSSV